MGFFAGLLPGLLLGVLIGFSVTTIARHARELAKALVKGGLVLADALARLGRALRARFGALVAEARSDLDKSAELDDSRPPPRRQPPRGFGGPFG